jgi:type I restriction enzyme S subunit
MREDWIEIEINEVANLYQPKTISSKMLVADGKYPVYGANGIIGNYDHYNHENEEFLITCRGATCGNVHITQPFSWINGNAMVVQPYNKSLLSLEYLRFVFSNKGRVQKAISGSAQPQITRTTLSPIKIPLSPLPEQRAIVAKIEELFSDLDKGIADLRKAQDQLKIYRQAVLKKAFEGELTKEWREQQTDLPTADELLEQIKEERQKHYEQKLKNWKQAVKAWEEKGKEGKKPGKPKFLKELEEFTDEDLSELHELDSYWNWVKVDKLCQYDQNAMKAGPFGSSLKKAFYTESGYKIYGQEQVISGDYKFGNYYVNNEKYQSLINCAVKPHDVLISLVGTVGKVLILPEGCEAGLINPRLVKFSLNDFYSEQFFKYFFESGFIKSIYKLKNHGTTMDVLNLGIIKELPFPLCSKKEQHQIVQEIESRLSVCDKVEESITESLEKAKALRQSILKKAFEGTLLSEEEIASCKAAPDYEPASVLLEKIKAEKKKNP